MNNNIFSQDKVTISLGHDDLAFIKICIIHARELKEDSKKYEIGCFERNRLLEKRDIHNDICVEKLEEILIRNNIEITEI